MYIQREVPEPFIKNLEKIRRMSSVLATMQRTGRLPPEEVFASSHVLTRAYRKIFPAFNVCDGIVTRLGLPNCNREYGEAGYFYYHEGRSRPAITGQLKLIPHSILVFKEPNGNMPKLAIDVLPLGQVKNWSLAAPIFLDEHSQPFFEQPLPENDAKDFATKARIMKEVFQEIKKEADELS